MGENREIAKINKLLTILKIFFLKNNTVRISTRVKGKQGDSNVGPHPCLRKIIAKVSYQHLKIFSSRTVWSISTKLGTNHPLVMGIQVCSNKEPCLIPWGDDNDF